MMFSRVNCLSFKRRPALPSFAGHAVAAGEIYRDGVKSCYINQPEHPLKTCSPCQAIIMRRGQLIVCCPVRSISHSYSGAVCFTLSQMNKQPCLKTKGILKGWLTQKIHFALILFQTHDFP